MYTGTRARDWDDSSTHGAAVVQRVEAGLPWEQDAERGRADQDGWLLSFIDVLTLLLTLFVLLLAYQHGAGARMGAVEIQAPAQSLPKTLAAIELGGALPEATAVVDADGVVVTEPVEVTDPAAVSGHASTLDYLALAELWETDWITPLLVQVAQATVPETPVGWNEGNETQHLLVPASESAAPPDAASPLDPVDRLLAELNEPALQGRVEVTRQPGGVNLEISDSILFTPASAALTEGGRALLDELAAILASLPYELSVEGHTDNRPIATDRFPSNWELASTRASRVTRHLIGEGIAPERVRAIGYADTRPLADNATPEGRTRNRRVSFILRLPAS